MGAAAIGEDGAEQAAADPAARRLFPRRRLPAIAAAAAGLMLAGLLAAAALRPNPGMVEIEIGGELVYHDFPDIIADLKDEGRRPRYVKLGIIVELPAELRPRLEESKTAIIDALHAYLRERRAEELVGEAGAERVRAALSSMINDALAPDQAKAVLFRQFILN
jgi:flagellar basal body-associated protein FliL